MEDIRDCILAEHDCQHLDCQHLDCQHLDDGGSDSEDYFSHKNFLLLPDVLVIVLSYWMETDLEADRDDSGMTT